MIDIAQVIRDLRTKKGLTLAQFAEMVGMSLSYISDLEQGRAKGTLDTWQKIGGAFGLTLVVRFENAQGVDPTEAVQREKARRYDVLKDSLKEIVQEMEARHESE